MKGGPHLRLSPDTLYFYVLISYCNVFVALLESPVPPICEHAKRSLLSAPHELGFGGGNAPLVAQHMFQSVILVVGLAPTRFQSSQQVFDPPGEKYLGR